MSEMNKMYSQEVATDLPTGLTGTLSGYFFRIFSPSARLFSKGCSSLYSHFIDALLQVQSTSLAVIKHENTSLSIQSSQAKWR